MGVSVGTDGSLSLDASKLSNALAAAPNDAAALIAKVGGEFSTTLEKFVGISGTIKIATDSADSMLKELAKRSEAIGRRLDTIEARYRKQFTALDTLVSGLNSTSSYLTQHLASLSSN
jgi:flagellar hook-associated protein 2